MKKQPIISLLCCFLLFVAGCSTPHQGNTYDIIAFGAKGDGKTDDAAAIQRAINACSAAGGGTVIIPAGHTFLCGPLQLASYVNLHLEPNSRLLANPDESIYTESAFRENRGEGMMWISGKNLKQISITGTGEIDGNGIAFMGKELDDSYELKPVTDFDPRPHVLTLINVEKTVIRDITIRNSAYWTVHLIGCYDALIDGISLLNNLKIRNGDGIDVDHSKKVRIANCFIESGDDCICLKNRREFEEYGSCEDIEKDRKLKSAERKVADLTAKLKFADKNRFGDKRQIYASRWQISADRDTVHGCKGSGAERKNRDCYHDELRL